MNEKLQVLLGVCCILFILGVAWKLAPYAYAIYAQALEASAERAKVRARNKQQKKSRR